MHKLYEEFLYVPKHGKVADKVMMTRLTLTVIVIVLCLAMMSISAYAYFSHNVTSDANKIAAAELKVNIILTDGSSAEVPLTMDESGTYTALLPVGSYTVRAETAPENTVKTGFCVVTLQGTEYHTQQIWAEEDAEGGKYSFVEFGIVANEETKFSIRPNWGTSIYYDKPEMADSYITTDESFTIGVALQSEPPVETPSDPPTDETPTDETVET